MNNKKGWRYASFALVAVMAAHLVLLVFSCLKYDKSFGFSGQNSGILFIAYLIPILIVLSLSIAEVFIKSKANSFSKSLALSIVKIAIVLNTCIVIFALMLMIYHNPTPAELALLSLSTLAVAICGVLLFVFEINKIKKEQA